MRKFILLVMTAVAVNGFSAVIEQETLELGLAGHMQFDNPRGDVGFSIYPTLGYFIMDNVQVGGMLGMTHDGRDMGVMFGGLAEINFDTYTAVMPFLAVRLSYNFGDAYDNNFVQVEGAGGLKFFISETLAISTELFYNLASEDVHIDHKDGMRNHDAGIRLGLRHYF